MLQMSILKNKKKPPKNPNTEEVRIMFCGPDHTTIENELPDFRYIGPVNGKKSHFIFSSLISPNFLPKLKKNIKKYVTLPNNIQIVSFFVMNEKEVYEPD